MYQVFSDLNLEYVFRLFVSFISGFIIGFEREKNGHHAGLKTHILVSVGATLVMIISFNAISDDPARIAAQVVSGIGFIGAGAIMQDRKSGGIKGITTAASLWVCAMIGLAIGVGFYLLTVVALVLVTIALIFVKKLEIHLGFKESKIDFVVSKNFNINKLFEILKKNNLDNFDVNIDSFNEDLRIHLNFKTLKNKIMILLIEEIKNNFDIIELNINYIA